MLRVASFILSSERSLLPSAKQTFAVDERTQKISFLLYALTRCFVNYLSLESDFGLNRIDFREHKEWAENKVPSLIQLNGLLCSSRLLHRKYYTIKFSMLKL